MKPDVFYSSAQRSGDLWHYSGGVSAYIGTNVRIEVTETIY